MNGRIYDYNLGRFLSVDPFIQAPGNSQSMNPYSYIMNNPLAGTDPTGYIGQASRLDTASGSVSQGSGTEEQESIEYDNAVALYKGIQKHNGAQNNQPPKNEEPEATTELESGKNTESSTNQSQGDIQKLDVTDPGSVDDDVVINEHFKGKITTSVDVKNKTYTIDMALNVGTESLTPEELSDALENIRTNFNVTVDYMGYKLTSNVTLKTTSTKDADFNIEACSYPCSAGSVYNGSGRARRGGNLIELGSVGNYTAAHEFGHMVGLGHQYNSTNSLMSYADKRSLGNGTDLQRLFQGYRNANY